MLNDNSNIFDHINNIDNSCDGDQAGDLKNKIKMFVDNFVSSSSSIEYFHTFVSKN